MDDEAGLEQRLRDDEKLLRRTEKALTEIKVTQGLSDEHASVLAALRIRLRGDPGTSLDDLLIAAGDLESGTKLDSLLSKPSEKRRGTLDDVLAKKPMPKPEWPSG